MRRSDGEIGRAVAMKVEGGTQAPEVPASVFVMPEGMSIRYDQPEEAIRDWFTGYHVYAEHGPAALDQVNWFLPGTANVRVTLQSGGPISVSIGNRRFDPVPQVALYGPTSHAMETRTNGGVMIGFGVSALGWARLTARPASEVQNLILPVARLVGEATANALFSALSAVSQDALVKPALDTLLPQLLGPPNPDEPIIRHLGALIVEDGFAEIADVAARLGIGMHLLRRVALRYFGLTPKLLLRRARFLRSYLRITQTEGIANYKAIDPSYYDVSHFLRDAQTFLGMTPRRFQQLQKPFLEASLRARAAVLGTPTQALQTPGADLPHRTTAADAP